MAERVFDAGRANYFTELQVLYGKYIEQVNDICKAVVPEAAKLDTPNVHRLLELTMRTFPIYGHVKHVSDLLFENKHQILKRGVQRDRQTTNNTWAMYTDCMDFWKANVASIVDELVTPSTDRDRRNDLLKSFQNILIGSHVDVDETEGSAWEFVNEQLLARITKSLKNMLKKETTQRSHYIARKLRLWSLGMGAKSLAIILKKDAIVEPYSAHIESAIRAIWPAVDISELRFSKEPCKGSNRALYLTLGDYFSDQNVSGFDENTDIFRIVLGFRATDGDIYAIALPRESEKYLPPLFHTDAKTESTTVGYKSLPLHH